MSLRSKLLVSCVFLAALVAAVGVLGLRDSSQVASSFEAVTLELPASLEELWALSEAVQGALNRHSVEVLSAPRKGLGLPLDIAQEKQRVELLLATQRESILKHLREFERHAGGAEQRAYAVDLEQAVERFFDASANARFTHLEGAPPEVVDSALDALRAASTTLGDRIEVAFGNVFGQLEYGATKARAHASLTRTLIGSAVVIAFFSAVALGLLMSRSILRPVAALTAAANRVARGDLDIELPRGWKAEMGVLANAFTHMSAELRASQSELQSRIEESNRVNAMLQHEIAERAKTEREKKSIHGQLVDASRRAGMAEVATGVLHNVGNVLNSVNVSASRVSSTVRGARIDDLVGVVELVNEHAEDLAAFLCEDERGRLVPEFFERISAHLRKSRDLTLEELASLTQNLDHIKEIVAVQQSNASCSGVWEPVDIEQLVEDALFLVAASLDRHEITVEKDFEPSGTITTDRHRVLQVLINLIRNAKDAMQGVSDTDHVLGLRIRQVEDGAIEIEVSDDGVGIDSENLRKIFQHGFSTKQDGHGFGLHIGSLAAKELGGSLNAASEGVGHGATFTLRLPRKPDRTP